MRHRLLLVLSSLLSWLAGGPLKAQEPFVCQGNAYIAITDGPTDTKVYEIEVDPNTGQAVFEPLAEGNSGVDLNAIGYRYIDNFIYGVNAGTLELYRVGRDGRAATLRTLDLGASDYLLYVAGDVSPDGKYLVMVGTGLFNDEILAFIDLDSPEFTARTLPLYGPEVRCADVAFDPIDGKLYGFDGIQHRLVSFDITSGEISADFPPTDQASIMGGLFFDTYGNLFGYGLAPNENAQRGLYRIDKQTGAVIRETIGPPASRNDGCSCPYTIGLLETVDGQKAIPCSEVTVRLEIVNNSQSEQAGLQLQQTFPEPFEILDISHSLGGRLAEGGAGTHFFRWEDLSLPQGQHEVTIRIALGPNTTGTYQLQALLSGLPEQLGGAVRSDDPATLIQFDSTAMEVGALEVDFSAVQTYLCAGDTILLNPVVPAVAGVSYQWSDGSTGPTLRVGEAGTYEVTANSGCEIVQESITVREIGFELDLGPDLRITEGQSIALSPRVRPSATGLSFSWTSSGAPVDCPECPAPYIAPAEDTRYFLTATDTSGCFAADSLLVEVVESRRLYVPNAFSPNGDGNNDRFFLHSQRDQMVLAFRIFDRWGNLLFEKANFYTNDPEQGWDGTAAGQALNPGLYYYLASVRFQDDEVVQLSGQVKMLR